MNKDELKKVEQFIESQHYTVDIEIFDNRGDEYDSPGQVVVLTADEKSDDFCYQTSSTCDAGAMCTRLEINNESGAINALSSALTSANFSDDFIEENLDEISVLIAKKLKVQELFDDALNNVGRWERAPNSLDANSEIFIRTDV